MGDIVWPYIFAFFPLKCIVSSLWHCYLSRMPWNPSYLFVRIPNLLCRLKYVNVNSALLAGINHFIKDTLFPGNLRIWRPGGIAHPDTSAITACKNLASYSFKIPSLQRKNGFLSASEAANALDHFSSLFLFLQKKKRPCRLPKERSHLSFLRPVKTRYKGRSKTTNTYVGKYRGLQVVFSDFTCDNLHCYIAFKKTENKFASGLLSLTKCALSQWWWVILSKSPEKRFVFLEVPGTAASVHRQQLEESQRKVSRQPLDLPLPASSPAAAWVDGLRPGDTPGHPRESTAKCPGPSRLPPVPSRAQGRGTVNRGHPPKLQGNEGVPELPGVLEQIHPQGFLFPSAQVTFICSNDQGYWGGITFVYLFVNPVQV